MRSNFNPGRYEEGLSPLGRSVLRVLINQWNAERDCPQGRGTPYSNQRRFPAPCYTSKNKVLRFDDATATAPAVNAMLPPSQPLHPPAPPPRPPAFVPHHPNTDSIPIDVPHAFEDPITDSDVTTHRNADILILNDTQHRFDHIHSNGHTGGYTLFDKSESGSPPNNLYQHRTKNKNNNYTFNATPHQIGNNGNNFTLDMRTHKKTINVETNRVTREFQGSLNGRTSIHNERNDIYTDYITPSTHEQTVIPFYKDKSRVNYRVPDINTEDSPPFEGIHMDNENQRKERTSPIPIIYSADERFTSVKRTSEKPSTETGRDREHFCREDLLNTPLVTKVSVDGNDRAGAIDWDDMFDTELVSHLEPSAQVTNDMQINFVHRLPEDLSDPPNKVVKPKIDKKNTKAAMKNKNNSPKALKRKVQTKVTATVPKKVKKADVVPKVPRNPLKKDKFTTVVKKWLNGLDPTQAPDEKVAFTSADNILVEKCKGKEKVSPAGKKIIQAQLANKDGIMKFGKPKPSLNNCNNTTISDTNNNEGQNTTTKIKEKATEQNSAEYWEVENKTSDTVTKIFQKENATKQQGTCSNSSSTKEIPNKLKKPKRKFVVPLKSQPSQSQQTPCDAEVHDVRAVHANDAGVCGLVSQGALVVMMLMYSNGFCQANAHHASVEGHADAVMVLITSEGEDRFYHVEGMEGAQAELLKHILGQCSIVCYDGKDLLKYLMVHLQLDVEHMELDVQDVKVAGSLLSPESPPESFPAVQRVLQQPPAPCGGDARNKAASYAVRLRAAARFAHAQLQDEGMWSLFTDIEMKVLPIIAAMEQRGLHVDTVALASLDQALEQAVQAAEHACHAAAHRVFPVQSPAAIRALIYDELKLDHLCKLKVKHTPAANDKSTSETMLKQLSSVHPLPRRILRYRQLHKVRATFVAGIKRHTHKDTLKPTWLQCAAATGRIACANPNLQALPKHPVYLDGDDDKCSTTSSGDDTARDDVTDDDDRLADPEAVDFLRSTLSLEAIGSGRRALSVRSVVSAGSADMVLLAADYRHLECRLLAHAAQDRRLLAALAAPDLFQELAMHWLNKPAASVSLEERERCKRVLYAAAYGCGSARLAELLGPHHTAATAHAVLNTFNKTFPSIGAFAAGVVSRCSAAGGTVRLHSGRRRTLPDINSADGGRRARAHRQAVNFTIQGTAADLCKRSMARTVAALHARGVHAALLLTVHDELVWTLPRHQLAMAREVVRQVMEGCGREVGGDTLRLPVALRSGPHWGDMTPL